MLALWLGLVGLSVSPRLHQALHPDSQQLSHECVVTLFASGQLLLSASGLVIVVVLSAWFGALVRTATPLCSARDLRLDLGRAPPSLLVSNKVVG